MHLHNFKVAFLLLVQNDKYDQDGTHMYTKSIPDLYFFNWCENRRKQEKPILSMFFFVSDIVENFHVDVEQCVILDEMTHSSLRRLPVNINIFYINCAINLFYINFLRICLSRVTFTTYR